MKKEAHNGGNVKDRRLVKKLCKTSGMITLSFLNNHGDGRRRLIHIILNLVLSFTLMISMAGICVSTSQAARIVRIADGDDWRYFKGNQEPPYKWNYPGFDYSKWLKGRTGIGYGARNFRTYLGDMKGSYQSIYAIRDFMINDPSSAKRITFSLSCDGPFVAYINGKEAIRNSVPVPIKLDLSGLAEFLVIGTNVLAVQCSNEDINSDDFSFIPTFEIHDD